MAYSLITIAGRSTSTPRRVTSIPQQIGEAAEETTSIRHYTGRRGETLTVRKGILLPVQEYWSPGRRRDPTLGHDEPLQLFGDGDDSFTVEINNSLAA